MSATDEIQEPVDGTPGTRVPDLPSQLEELLDEVWRSEANWALDDRIDLSLRIRPDRGRT